MKTVPPGGTDAADDDDRQEMAWTVQRIVEVGLVIGAISAVLTVLFWPPPP